MFGLGRRRDNRISSRVWEGSGNCGSASMVTRYSAQYLRVRDIQQNWDMGEGRNQQGLSRGMVQIRTVDWDVGA